MDRRSILLMLLMFGVDGDDDGDLDITCDAAVAISSSVPSLSFASFSKCSSAFSSFTSNNER